MDIEQVRTFLTILDEGNFVRAVETLHVTQSTVSARMKELEAQLGQYLLIRGRAGCRPTSAGLRFESHARTMMRALHHARQDIGLPEKILAILNVGGQQVLWDKLLSAWIARLRQERPDIAVRASVEQPDVLHQLLAGGLLDISVAHAARTEAGLVAEHLFDDHLVMASNLRGRHGVDDPRYVFVDWGPEFRSDHAVAYGEASMPGLRFSVGSAALGYILEHGGMGYFPLRTLKPLLDAKQLRRVAGMPSFDQPTYVTYRQGLEDEGLDFALDLLRATVQEAVNP